MIDLHHLRENPEAYETACQKKRFNFDIRAFLKLDDEYRVKKQEFEALRAKQNAFSKELPKLSGDDKNRKLDEMKSIAEEVRGLTTAVKELEDAWMREQLLIPSIPLDKVPLGKDDTENVEIRRCGEPPKFTFKPKDHVQLGKDLDIIDIERGVKVAGSRNYFLKGDGVRLQHAILQLSLDLLHRKGFTLMEPHHIVKYSAMMGTGYFPGGEEQAYHMDDRDPDLYLIGTSEVSVCAYFADETLPLETLPRRMAGYSPCYRREAGTYGKDTQGIYRIHQFYKVEQVIICEADPAKSAALHAEILQNSEEVLGHLEIPYRVVDVCTGDLGRGQVYKNDIEAWMPSRNSYCETHSCSTLHDFQARRLGLKYKDSSGKNRFCHTLNNTCIASPRILIPFLEIHQKEDGGIKVPVALRPYLGGQEFITKG